MWYIMLIFLTHILTHNRKCLGGNSGTGCANDLLILERKWPESLENTGKDSLSTFRNQQVVCLSHITSSRKQPEIVGSTEIGMNRTYQLSLAVSGAESPHLILDYEWVRCGFLLISSSTSPRAIAGALISAALCKSIIYSALNFFRNCPLEFWADPD